VKDWKEGGESSHKVQCKCLIEIRESYVEKVKKEIEEQMAKFGVQDGAGDGGGGAGPSSAS
jgi:hypothetical protein